MKRPPITTMKALLQELSVPKLHSKKYSATLICYDGGANRAPMRIELSEYFDDGQGHSGAYTHRCTPVEEKVFRDAKRKGHITNVRKPGSISENEFKISDSGERRLQELLEEERQEAS